MGPEASDKPAPYQFHLEYLLRAPLGSGAFGHVYSATKVDNEAIEVAVKVMDLRKAPRRAIAFADDDIDASLDPRRQAAIRNEVNRLKQVAGAVNVCQLLDTYVHHGLAYLVLEKCDRSLLHALERVPLLNEETLRPFLRGMLEALSVVHGRGVVHRDVKPDNFLCSGPGDTIKLCDFGLAGKLPADGAETCTGICGTSPFMAPEMLQGATYGAKVDIWSYGVTVYVLCLGKFPYMPTDPAGPPTGPEIKASIVAGVPAPCFEARDMRGYSRISESMVSWLRGLLNRSVSARPFADEALAHEHFSSPDARESSLKPMLNSARCWGAIGDATHPPRCVGGVDLRLRELQERHHPSAANTAPASEASTDAGSIPTASGQASVSNGGTPVAARAA